MRVLKIGRSPDNDIVINDPYASRAHCDLIVHDNGIYELIDHSSYGTYVNGQRIIQKVVINPGDVIKAGNSCVPWMAYVGAGSVNGPATLYKPSSEPIQMAPPPPAVTPVIPAPPVVNIPSEINVSKREEYSNVAKKGDDFQVSFNRNLGDRMGNTIGTTLGCIVSIIIVIALFAIIGLVVG